MSFNKNALIRYNTIDKCLRDSYKKYSLEDLVNACSEVLFEMEDKQSFVSKRTIQLDLQNMRSEKLGYQAPIEVYQRKYYRYSDSSYSIHQVNVRPTDVKAMKDAIQILKQFKNFSMFRQMNGTLQKLEDSIETVNQKPIIHLDKNENLQGLNYLDLLYEKISQKKVLYILYQSFSARKNQSMLVHPQLLKEYNNRWYLICWHNNSWLHLALDRMQDISVAEQESYLDKNLDADNYFSKAVGVTICTHQRPRNIEFSVLKHYAPYIKTKPIHHSQEILQEDDKRVLFRICVQINLELQNIFLGLCEFATITKPSSFRKKIITALDRAKKSYLSTCDNLHEKDSALINKKKPTTT